VTILTGTVLDCRPLPALSPLGLLNGSTEVFSAGPVFRVRSVCVSRL